MLVMSDCDVSAQRDFMYVKFLFSVLRIQALTKIFLKKACACIWGGDFGAVGGTAASKEELSASSSSSDRLSMMYFGSMLHVHSSILLLFIHVAVARYLAVMNFLSLFICLPSSSGSVVPK